MASCRMLTQLLRIDNIAYALRPVSNFDQVVENYEAFMTSEIKTVILINCGAVSLIHAFNGTTDQSIFEYSRIKFE
jgi:CDC45-like protein